MPGKAKVVLMQTSCLFVRTAIHDTRQGHTTCHGGNERFEDIIVTKDTRLGVIQGAKGFVHAVFLVTVVIPDGASVSGIMDKASVTGLRRRGQGLEGYMHW